jgi:two-component system, OmpR family, phosphate regulon sensor histidine kinase PhoR
VTSDHDGHRLVLHYLVYPLIIVVTFLMVTLINARILREAIYDAHTRDLAVTARVLANAIPPEGFVDRDGAAAALAAVAAGTPIRVTLIAADGTVLADTHGDALEMDNHLRRPEVVRALQGRPEPFVRRSSTLGEDLIYIAIPVYQVEPEGGRGAPAGVVRSAVIVDDVRSRLAILLRRVVFPGVVMLLLALLAAASLSRSIRIPLRRLHQAARAYAAGDLDYSVSVEGARELVELGRTLRGMARELKLRLEEVDQQRRETEEVLNTIREPLFVIDGEARIRRLNAAAARFLRVDGDDARGRLFTDLFRNSRAAEFLRRLREGESVQEEVIEAVGRGEQYLALWGVRLSSRGSLLRDASLLVMRDITAEYRLDRTRRDFVSNVSHELRTPLTMIQGAAETLSEMPASEEESRRTFERMILSHTERMGRIVEDLLNLARLEQENSIVQRRPSDVAALVRECVSVAEESHQRSVAVSLPTELVWPVEGSLLSLSLTNLLDNALRYTGDDGAVVVAASIAGDQLTITVADEGPGIPASEVDRVFERFYRIDRGRSRDRGGTGLGLAIVRHAVRSQGGTVTLTSVVGKGSTFSITIPRGGQS